MPLDVELAEIRDFLAQHPPFDVLPPAVLTALPAELSVTYRRRGSVVLDAGMEPDELLVVRSGAVETRAADGALLARGGEGATVGGEAMVTGIAQPHRVTAVEDTLLLAVPADVLRRLGADQPDLAAWFTRSAGSLLREAARDPAPATGERALLWTRAGDLVTRPPVAVPATTSIREAARVMAEHRVSSVLVTTEGRLAGILTDRDLRSRVLAAGVDPAGPVSGVMTADPVTGSPAVLALEALLDMVRHGVHHLPLVDGGHPVGMVTPTDLMRLEVADPVHLMGEVAAAPDADAVAALAGRLGGLVDTLARQGTPAHAAGRLVTTVGDAVERRLVDLAAADLGGPPVPYAWVTLGSRARHEQALGSDQDHALVLHDDHRPEHDPWFAELAERVVAGLERAGHPRCRGDKMATNPLWRVPLSTWRAYVDDWVRRPVPGAVLEAAVFFDLRHLAGDAELAQQLADHQRASTRGANLFLAHLAGQAAARPVPIGFFRGLVVDRGGDHRDTLDLKQGGLGVVVQVARVHALAVGSGALATQERVADAVSAGRVSAELGADLVDAWELFGRLRLRHQAEQVRAGQAPDNRIAPAALSSLEQRHLRAAFGVLRTAQSALGQRHPLQAVL